MEETNEWIADALQEMGERLARIDRDMMFYEGQRMLLVGMMMQSLVKSGAVDRNEAITTLLRLLEGTKEMAKADNASQEPTLFVDQLSRLLNTLREL
jgi:hypothetical protein